MNNERRAVLAALCGVALCPGRVVAQQSARTYRVAYVVTTAALKPGRFFATLRSRLAGKGFVEGDNLELRFFALRPDEEVSQSHARVLDEAVAWNPDAVMAGGVMCAKRLRKATDAVPIVFFGIQDPQSQGLVDSLARPGGNATGTGVHYDELAVKRLELIRELLPAAKRVAVVIDRTFSAISPSAREALTQASQRLGLGWTEIDVAAASDGLCAAGTLAREAGADAAITWGSFEPPARLRGAKRWYAECATALQREARIPLVDDTPEMTEEGVAAALGEDTFDGFRRAADMVGDILAGSRPATTPVDMQMRVRMFVNARALQSMGVEPPTSVRVRADRLIQ